MNDLFEGNKIAEELNIQIANVIPIQQCKGLIIERQTRTEHFKSPLTCVDIDGFFVLMNNILIDAQDKSNIPEKYRLTYTHEYPDYGASEDNDGISDIDKSLDGIIYRVIGRSPAPMSGPIDNKEKAQYKPCRRERLNSTNSDYEIEQWGLWMRTIVEFECFSTKNRIAEKRALWLEDVIWDYLWYFQMHGVEIIYKERLTDRVNKVDKQTYYLKPLTYWVRTEKVYHKLIKKLDSISVRYDIGNTIETTIVGNTIYQQLHNE